MRRTRLRWIVQRLLVPTGMRPLTRTEMLDAATPRGGVAIRRSS